MKKLTIIVGGYIGILPLGGVTWDYVQYPLGLTMLGHDVYYIEDTKLYPLYQKQGTSWDDCLPCVEYLKAVMSHFSMEDKWAYRDEASGRCYGLSDIKLNEICSKADLFINISCSTVMREEYLKIPNRIVIDTDPMFTQIQYLSDVKFTPGQPSLRQLIESHTHHFTFGENISEPDSRIPSCGFKWEVTRQPVCLNQWVTDSEPPPVPFTFTTFMNWSAGKVLQFDGEGWGQKDTEFLKYISIPSRFGQAVFSVVINKTGGTTQVFPEKMLNESGWNFYDPFVNSSDWKAYREFISQSSAEFSVAKNTYVKARSGWFSCRSACYLAMGKPVVTQDTGWSKFIPSGNGLFGFNDLPDAAAAINTVMNEYRKQSSFAREVANEYFDSRKVLIRLLSHL